MKVARITSLLTASLVLALPLSARADRLVPPASAGETSCTPIPPGKKVVKVRFRPATPVSELAKMLHEITCRRYVFSEELGAKRVTIAAPGPLTVEELERVAGTALAAEGLGTRVEGERTRIEAR